LARAPESIKAETLPKGAMEALGHGILQQPIKLNQPYGIYNYWRGQVTAIYANSILNQP
jgi:hypothetical protein